MPSLLQDILFGGLLLILFVVALSLEFDIAPSNPKLRRVWVTFAYVVLGLFLIWMIVLFGLLK